LEKDGVFIIIVMIIKFRGLHHFLMIGKMQAFGS